MGGGGTLRKYDMWDMKHQRFLEVVAPDTLGKLLKTYRTRHTACPLSLIAHVRAT